MYILTYFRYAGDTPLFPAKLTASAAELKVFQ